MLGAEYPKALPVTSATPALDGPEGAFFKS